MAMEAKPRRRWDVVKWVGFALLLTGVGANAMASISGKADSADVKELRAHLREHDIQFTRLEADNAWIKSALFALTQRAGVVVPPPPIP
jgi:hypothetical protein